MMEYKNSDIEALIDEYVHNARDRDILKRRFIHGQKFEALAYDVGLSVRQVKNIVYKKGDMILQKIPTS